MSLSCLVCNTTIAETRAKNLKQVPCGKEAKKKTLLDLVTSLASSSGRGKSAKGVVSDHACLPCFRELMSIYELKEMLENKQNEICRKISETRSQSVNKNSKKATSPPTSIGSRVLSVTKEIVSRQERTFAASLSEIDISMRSMIGMDAEITITEEENGSTAIDVEVVEGISDLKRDNGLFGCRFCKKEFVDSKYSITHMQEVHGKLLHSCDVCGAEFRLRSEIDQHKASHLKEPPLPFQCSQCPKGFNSFEHFQEHTRVHEMKKKFGCAQCGRRFDDDFKLNQHMLSHQSKPFYCAKCNKHYRSHHSCAKHQKLYGETAGRFNCNLCSKSFTSADYLHNHLKNHNKAFKCELCDKGFDTELQLSSHSHITKRNIECKICDKQFISLVQLEAHNRVHTGEKPFQCDACGATFAQRSNLDSHQRAVHLQERRFKCSDCDKGFKRRRLLQYHIKSVHTGEKPFTCEVCSASFVYPEHFKKHMLTHSGIKPWSCEICGKTFSSKDNRNSHRFTHSNRKPYECRVCGMSFMRKPALLQHLIDEGHGDPETAGASVKIVSVLTGHEMDPESNDPDPVEWSTMEIQSDDNFGMVTNSQNAVQTIIIPDEHGNPIEIQVISSDSSDPSSHQLDQIQFELSAEALNVIQAFELQGGNIDDSLAALM